MLAITVNDRPLDVSAIVERGRVLVPMSATFEALGANISYDPQHRIIVASSLLHTLRLQIGSQVAMVDGKSVRLEVPARMIAARTYVPLRFVAQAMGAIVGYDASAQLVTITATTLTSLQPAGKPEIMGLSPAPDTAVASAYPTISATLGMGLALPGSVTLTLDGTDVTALSTFDGTTITYMPRSGLSRGMHTVVFAGRTSNQALFSQRWSFSTSLAPPAEGGVFRTRDIRFYSSGPSSFYAGDTMHFVLIAPPNGHAEVQLCTLGAFPLLSTGGTMYTLSIPAPSGIWMPSCQVTAVYTSWSGARTYVPVPLYVGLFTRPIPAVTPHPHSTSRPLPAGPRRTPQPAPTPLHLTTPAPIPVPVLTPHPITTAHPIATSHPPVRPVPTRRPLPIPNPRRTPR